MNAKLIPLVLAIGAVAVPTAVGARGYGKPIVAECGASVSVELQGTVASSPGTRAALPFALMVDVRTGNRAAAAYVHAAQPLTVTVTPSTAIHRGHQMKGTLAGLRAGEHVTVLADACRPELANGATPALNAARIDSVVLPH
jgi:hypothetical protein